MSFELAGKHALVAGVGGPLARPAAVALAEGGATVSLLTRDDDRAQEVEAQSILNECWSLGHDGGVVRLDSSDPAAVARALDDLEAAHGPIVVLVAVAPEAYHAPAAELTRKEWDAALAAATATTIPMLAAGRRMIDRRDGRILALVADLGGGDFLEMAVSAAAQGAVSEFARALAAEWAARGVVVRMLSARESEAGTGPHAHARFREALRAALLEGVPSGEADAVR